MYINDGRIITEIIKHLINGSELTIFGDGLQTRSICYVDDTVHMLVKLMASEYQKPINIGNNQEMSVNNIVQITVDNYKKYTKTKLNIVYKDLTQNDPLMRCPCLKLNKSILQHTDYTSINDGISNTIDYFLQKSTF